MRAARLISAGVRRNPSRLVIANATPQIVSVFGMLSNCMNATSPRPPVTMTGPRYGIELKMPAINPQMTYCWSPSHHKDNDQHELSHDVQRRHASRPHVTGEAEPGLHDRDLLNVAGRRGVGRGFV